MGKYNNFITSIHLWKVVIDARRYNSMIFAHESDLVRYFDAVRPSGLFGTGTIMLLSQLLWNNSKKYTNGLMQMRRNSMAEEL